MLPVIMLAITSCGEENDEPYWEEDYEWEDEYGSGQSFEVSPSTMSFSSYGGTQTAYLYGSSSDVSASYIKPLSVSWCSCSKSSSSISVTVQPNTSTYSRSTTIYIESSNGFTLGTIYVSQSGTSDSGSGNTDSGSGNTGGNTDSGSSITKPSAPSYVSVDNYGSVLVPDIRVTWGSVSNATGYKVYRSTSASSGYSLVKTTSSTYYIDNSCKIGNVYYYKVKSYNSAGESDYSNYAMFEYKDTRKPGPVTYGNCSVSGSNMTLRWSVPTDSSYGKPTKAIVRVYFPDAGDYIDYKELSGTATSVTFVYSPYVDSSGFVKAGVILENDYGSGGGTPKVYDTKNKRWIY